MAVRSTLPSHSPAEIREILRGLPTATGYTVTVKPLRYRTAPHLQAFTWWDHPEIVLQVPEPFRPFRELVDLGSEGWHTLLNESSFLNIPGLGASLRSIARDECSEKR